MQRYKIIHRTYYNFGTEVRPGPHTLLLRPREGHELRVESSKLDIRPAAQLRWQRDVEDNSVAIATFSTSTMQLAIESEVIIQQFNLAPLDFFVADYAVNYPFSYSQEEMTVLQPYIDGADHLGKGQLGEWIGDLWRPGEQIQTFALLDRLNVHIHKSLSYQLREEPGVQSVTQTLSMASGSCRDFASLFIEAARHLGLAARFVSGYLHAQPSPTNFGATHAWSEVFLPGAGWKGFDPSTGSVVGTDHIPVAVARDPRSVPPVSGTFTGPPGASLDVGVWVTEL